MKIGGAIAAGIAVGIMIAFPPAGLIGLAAGVLGAVSTTTAVAAVAGEIGKTYKTEEDGSSCSEIAKGAAKTICEGQPVARITDPNTHGDGEVQTGSSKVYEGGLPVTRVGEASTCGGEKILAGAKRTIVGGASVSSGKASKVDERNAAFDEKIAMLDTISTVTGLAGLGFALRMAFRAGASAALQKAVRKEALPRAVFKETYRATLKAAPAVTPEARRQARSVARDAAIRSMAPEAAKQTARRGGAAGVAKVGAVAGGMILATEGGKPVVSAALQDLGGMEKERADAYARGIMEIGPNAIPTSRVAMALGVYPKPGKKYVKDTWSGFLTTMSRARAERNLDLALVGGNMFRPPRAPSDGGSACTTCAGASAAANAAPNAHALDVPNAHTPDTAAAAAGRPARAAIDPAIVGPGGPRGMPRSYHSRNDFENGGEPRRVAPNEAPKKHPTDDIPPPRREDFPNQAAFDDAMMDWHLRGIGDAPPARAPANTITDLPKSGLPEGVGVPANKVDEAFGRLDQTPIDWNPANNECAFRAHHMADELTAMGIPNEKIWAKSNGLAGPDNQLVLRSENGRTPIDYHVAVVVPQRQPDGRIVDMVIDPSVENRPVPIDDWLSRMEGPHTVERRPSSQLSWYTDFGADAAELRTATRRQLGLDAPLSARSVSHAPPPSVPSARPSSIPPVSGIREAAAADVCTTCGSAAPPASSIPSRPPVSAVRAGPDGGADGLWNPRPAPPPPPKPAKMLVADGYALTDFGASNLGRGMPLPRWATDFGALKGKRVIDVGAGGGQFVRELKDAGVDAYGIDLHTEKFIEAALPSNDHFVQASASQLPLRDAAFDVAYSNWSVFYYAPNETIVRDSFRELARVVKPGGEIRLMGVDPKALRQLAEVPELRIIEKTPEDRGAIPALRLERVQPPAQKAGGG